MSRRYASVDRSKEMKAKRIVNPIFHHPNLVLNVNEFDINNMLNKTKPNILRTLNPKRFKPKKLPLINKQITSSHLGDINSKTSDMSTEVNNAFSFEKDNIENNNVLKTETNKDNYNDDYFKFVINSDLRDRSSEDNTHLISGKKLIKQKIKINEKIKREIVKTKYPPILKSERLYPKKLNDKNSINIVKTIKAIRNNHLSLKKNKNNYTIIKSIPDNIAYESKFENIVFDANKLLNKHNFKENDLNVNNNINDFMSQNKEMCLDNLLIKLIKKENKNLKDNFETRNKEVEKLKKKISKDETDFELYSVKQKNLHYKTSDLLDKILTKNYSLKKKFYELRSKSRALEDEIFKMIEQIESLRIYAKFVISVLGGNDKLFEGTLIPDYKNSNRPDINVLVKKVFDKHGNLLKKNKLSMTSNTNYTINNQEKNKNNNDYKNSKDETLEEIDMDLLNDPLFMIRKFKEIEERILYFVEKSDIFNKSADKEYEYNEQILKDMKLRIINLTKELEYSKKNLSDFKNILYQQDYKNNENQDFFIIIKELNQYIFETFKMLNYTNKSQKIKNNNTDIFELINDVSKCINLLIKKEREIENYINNLEIDEKSDKKLFYEITNERKNELKYLNQNKNKENINIEDNEKFYKIYAKSNKIIIKSKKCEPPYYKIKKEVVIKENPDVIIEKENSEFITYK